MSELAAVKRKISALLSKTIENGATESESMFAMKKAGELLLQFNLSMDEVTLRHEPCVTKSFDSPNKGRDSIWHAFDGIRRLCGVKVWITKRTGGGSWSFFGLESDVDMAIYLCRLITSAERSALAEFKRSEHYQNYLEHRRIASRNFVLGFGARVNDRLTRLAADQLAAERQAHAHTQSEMSNRMVTADDSAYTSQPQGTALICLAKEQKIEEEFKKIGPKLRQTKSYSKSRVDYNARLIGASAGDKVNLSRPLNGVNNHAMLR